MAIFLKFLILFESSNEWSVCLSFLWCPRQVGNVSYEQCNLQYTITTLIEIYLWYFIKYSSYRENFQIYVSIFLSFNVFGPFLVNPFSTLVLVYYNTITCNFIGCIFSKYFFLHVITTGNLQNYFLTSLDWVKVRQFIK